MFFLATSIDCKIVDFEGSIDRGQYEKCKIFDFFMCASSSFVKYIWLSEDLKNFGIGLPSDLSISTNDVLLLTIFLVLEYCSFNLGLHYSNAYNQ